MEFFNFKLIGIIFLIILFFILFYEVSYLQSKVEHLTKCYDKLKKIDSSFSIAKKTNKNISSEDYIDFNDDYSEEKLNKNLDEKLNENLNKNLDDNLNEKLDDNLNEKLDDNLDEKLDKKLDENLDYFYQKNYDFLLDEKLDEKLDENFDGNFDENLDFLNDCLIKTINIPIDINNILANYSNVEIIEIFPTEIVLDNSKCDLQFIQHDTDIIDKNNSHVEIYSNDQSDMDPIVNITNQPDKNISQPDENISQSDKNIKQSETKQIDNSYKNILKKILKYKLPELQDISIKYKLPLQINKKKKTRLELIEDIKNYINKNI
jgi:uncharacterized membrane protein YheB (UPF0754 family)